VNALWYNALCIMRDLADKYEESKLKDWYQRQAEKTRQGFLDLFWNERENLCFDRVEDHFRDPVFRPNQLLTIALPHPLLEGEHAKLMLARLRAELYTTFGFRTLSPGDENYRGTYSGDMLSREGATYQGTVWPWLFGAYADALRNLYGDIDQVRDELRRLLKPFEEHLLEAGLGTISEMFDGDAPHLSRGCFARAWNVSEILRVHMSLMK
jgi:glycogen debranching enzyme